MAIREGFVASVLIVAIDAQRSLLDNGPHQIEAGVLIPAGSFVKVRV
jgi:hypothetical protein